MPIAFKQEIVLGSRDLKMKTKINEVFFSVYFRSFQLTAQFYKLKNVLEFVPR